MAKGKQSPPRSNIWKVIPALKSHPQQLPSPNHAKSNSSNEEPQMLPLVVIVLGNIFSVAKLKNPEREKLTVFQPEVQ